jgi:hypothetical protein
MTIRTRIDRLESRRSRRGGLFLAHPWTQAGPVTADNPPTLAQIAEHQANLRNALRTGVMIIDRQDPQDFWQVRAILDGDPRPGIHIERAYGQTTP